MADNNNFQKEEDEEHHDNNNDLQFQLACFNHDLVDQCDDLRRSNLVLREEILRLQMENANLKKTVQTSTPTQNLNPTKPEEPAGKNEEIDLDSGPSSIHISSISIKDQDEDEENEAENETGTADFNKQLIDGLRAEIASLRQWKTGAIQEIVERDKALVDLEEELMKQQTEFYNNNEECMGHQQTIQELKSVLDCISAGERTVESPFSERPKSCLQLSRHSPGFPQDSRMLLQSSFARCLNLPPSAMDQVTWLENELLETRQRLILTEADLARLEEVHGALLREHKLLQEDYERIHIYVEDLELRLEAELITKDPFNDDDFKSDYGTIVEELNERLKSIDKMKEKLCRMKEKQMKLTKPKNHNPDIVIIHEKP